jgi:hypothetical protein
VAAGADRAFATESIVKKSDEFVCVRGSGKQADQLGVKDVPCVVFTDPDGDEIGRSVFGSEQYLERAMGEALKKYANAPVSWGGDVKAVPAGKLLVVGFDDEKGEALKVVEDRTLVKFHDRCVFVKLPSEKGSEALKQWNVVMTPTLVLCDPSKENPEKNVIEKLGGKKSPREVRAAILRALKKLDGARKETAAK